MLYDPRRDISLQGFAAFVANKMLLKGTDAKYDWEFSDHCPVALYLQAVDLYQHDWYNIIGWLGKERSTTNKIGQTLRQLDGLAHGGRKNRRTWGALHRRVQGELADNTEYVEAA